jgi:hypothetical protein
MYNVVVEGENEKIENATPHSIPFSYPRETWMCVFSCFSSFFFLPHNKKNEMKEILEKLSENLLTV